MHRHLCRFALLFTVVCLATGCSFMPLPEQQADMELPSYSDTDDIVRHLGYTASYNHTTLCPDWVAWELTADEANGSMDGQYSFSRDPDVQFPKASREDYANSGWDKGHMAPRADMKWSLKALEESYYFTNICPQDHGMNAGAWRKIEEMTRRIARSRGAVMVVCGPLFDSTDQRRIGAAGVHIPHSFFKALAVNTPQGWQTVGFLVPNSPQNKSVKSYAVSVDSVEAVIARTRGTSLNLFPTLPEEAEGSVDWQWWEK